MLSPVRGGLRDLQDAQSIYGIRVNSACKAVKNKAKCCPFQRKEEVVGFAVNNGDKGIRASR